MLAAIRSAEARLRHPFWLRSCSESGLRVIRDLVRILPMSSVAAVPIEVVPSCCGSDAPRQPVRHPTRRGRIYKSLDSGNISPLYPFLEERRPTVR